MDHARLVADVATLHLESERLVLRRFRAEDLDTAVAHEQDPRIMRYVREIPTIEAARAKVAGFLAAWNGGDGEWLAIAITARAAPGLIGMLALRITLASNETVELGYRLHPDHWGQGIAAEACRTLLAWLFTSARVRKVIAHCAVDNVASFRVMEKVGMQREGRLREHSTLCGVWIDEFVYGLLAREWPPAGVPSATPRVGV